MHGRPVLPKYCCCKRTKANLHFVHRFAFYTASFNFRSLNCWINCKEGKNTYHPSSNSQLFNSLSRSFSSISKSLGLIYSPLMLPSTIYNTLEHLAATFASWVTIIIVVPSSFNFTNSSITSFDAVLFKAPVGAVKLVQMKFVTYAQNFSSNTRC